MTIDERISELKQHLPDVDEAGVWEHIETASIAARRRRSALMAAASVAAAAVLVVGWVGLTNLDTSRLPVTSDPAQIDVPFEQMATIRQLVDAVNARDAEAFIDAFTTEGTFNPRGDFGESSSLFGNSLPVSDVQLVQAWMAIIDAWGLEADLKGCSLLTDADETVGVRGNWGLPRTGPDRSLVQCDVATRWHSLSLELTEGWVYRFSGTQLDGWGFDWLDLNPSERTLPLGYDGLEAWEAWLVATDPLSADRYLNPRVRPSEAECLDDSCAQFEAALAPNDPELAARLGRLLWAAEKQWSIEGHEFSPDGLIPYDPALADEIEASIHEYLETK